MDLITHRDLERLAEIDEPYCVSIYMPAHRAGHDNAQDRIRLKNLLDEGEEQMVARGLRSSEARHRLQPARDLLDDRVSWENPGNGLAIFSSGDAMRRYTLPPTFLDSVHVGRRFHVLPLIPMVTEDARFYILGLSPKHVRFFEATRYSIKEVAVPGMPISSKDLADRLGQEESLTYHATASHTARQYANRGAMVHGHGVGIAEDHVSGRALEFCQRINDSLTRALADKREPLVVACDVAMISTFHEANQYPYLVDEYVPGNPALMKPEQLRDQAWKLVAPRLDEPRRKALDALGMGRPRGRASARPEQVLTAASDGRVDTLLVAEGAQVWGQFDPERRAAEIHPQPQSVDEELVNMAAVLTYASRGAVFTYPRSQLPNDAPIAAVLRY